MITALLIHYSSCALLFAKVIKKKVIKEFENVKIGREE